MEYAHSSAVLIGFIIVLFSAEVAVLVTADGSLSAAARNCTVGGANDGSDCIDIDQLGRGKEIKPSGDKFNRNRKSEGSDKYGLVPPFLGAASAVIIIYIVIHCLYLHCYAKKKMKRMAQHNALHSSPTPATIVLTDHPSSASMQPMTPIVKYDGAYGKTEVLQAHPYFMRSSSSQSQGQGQQGLQGHGQDSSLLPGSAAAGAGGTEAGTTGGRQLHQAPPSPKAVEIIKSGAKRTSSLLSSIKSRSSKKSCSTRMSTSSVGTDISFPEQEALMKAQRSSLDQGVTPAIRTNVCFVPYGKTVTDLQANESSEWIPVQGYIFAPKALENGDLASSFSSLQNCASQIVFIPMTVQAAGAAPAPAPPSAEDTKTGDTSPSVAMEVTTTTRPDSSHSNKEMQVCPEESESRASDENAPIIFESPVFESSRDTENVTVEIHNSPIPVET